MNIQKVVGFALKVLLVGILFFVGALVGGMSGAALGLRAEMPAGMDQNTAMLGMLVSVPLVALGLALVAPRLAGGRFARALTLALLAWVAYGLNNALEASIILPAGSALFNAVFPLLGSVLAGAGAALLWRSPDPAARLGAAARAFWRAHTAGGSVARLAVAAVCFMPVYYAFGLVAIQFTRDYYTQNYAGLTAPTLEQLLPVLFLRSVLFLVVCLPVALMWRGTERGLWVRLGLALFIFVGFASLAGALWLPDIVRGVHSLEILADELVYAWLLAKLLAVRETRTQGRGQALPRPAPL